jgi:hypothetical protein
MEANSCGWIHYKLLFRMVRFSERSVNLWKIRWCHVLVPAMTASDFAASTIFLHTYLFYGLWIMNYELETAEVLSDEISTCSQAVYPSGEINELSKSPLT